VSGPAVLPGDLVVVLEWAHPLTLPTPWVDLVSLSTWSGPRVIHPDRPSIGSGVRGGWAQRWRLPTPEELAAYQLSQLTGGGL
jgi:hypothetical protein